jgi:hypothetical protein
MGFYVDGVPHNKKGSIKAGESSVSWGKYADGKIEFVGGGGDPYGSIRINFYELIGKKHLYYIKVKHHLQALVSL